MTKETLDLLKLYLHLKKRVADEFGIEITPEWEKKVIDGAHDEPLPYKPGIMINNS